MSLLWYSEGLALNEIMANAGKVAIHQKARIDQERSRRYKLYT